MPLLKSILIIIGFYIASVLVFDIIGVLVNSFFDIFAGRSKSTLLYYTVWFVGAIFAGIIFANLAYSYTNKNTIVKDKPIIIAMVAILLSAVAIWIFYYYNQMDDNNAYYVPGNMYMTYTFFITFILAAAFGCNMAVYKPKKKET